MLRIARELRDHMIRCSRELRSTLECSLSLYTLLTSAPECSRRSGAGGDSPRNPEAPERMMFMLTLLFGPLGGDPNDY